MLMAREFRKGQIRLNGPNYSDRGRFDKKEISGKFKESPRAKNESSENAERLFLENSTAC